MSRLVHESRECGFPSIHYVWHWYQILTTSERILQDELANRTGDLYIRSICFSPDGKFLATGAEDRQIRVILLPSFFSQRGLLLIQFLQIWDLKQRRICHLLQGHMQEIYSLDFSRDGRFLVSGSGDKSARIWDVEKGTCVFNLQIEDFIHNEHGPIDAGITSVACEFIPRICPLTRIADWV